MPTVTTVFTTINGMLVHEDRGGVETEYVSDPLGSLVQTRNSSGTKTYEAEYWPYGELQTSTGTNPSSWGYVGLLGYLTDFANMLYVRARYLMTKFAMWLTVDSLWPMQPGHVYVKCRPSFITDRFGMADDCSKPLKPCTDLLLGDLNDFPLDLYKCLKKAKGNKEEQEACIKTYGKGLKGKAANNLIQYLACVVASEDSGSLNQGGRRMNPCSDPYDYGLACCHMKYLACMMNCLRNKYSDVDLGACLGKCRNNATKCGMSWNDYGD